MALASLHGMTNDELKTIARRAVTDLVKQEFLVKRVGDTITLVKPVWGYQGEIAFRDDDQAIDALSMAFVNHYASSAGLKAAS